MTWLTESLQLCSNDIQRAISMADKINNKEQIKNAKYVLKIIKESIKKGKPITAFKNI